MDISSAALTRSENTLLQTLSRRATILFVRASPSPASESVQPATIRLDPAPSRVFSWLEWISDAPELLDETSGRTLRPAGPLLHVRFRGTGSEWEHWPVSAEEARRVMNPGPEFDFGIGKAYGSIIKAHKSGRQVKPGERQATREQREQAEQRAGRRWLA